MSLPLPPKKAHPMTASTLRTPLSPAFILTRTIAAHAVTIEIHDDTGKALYAEEIAIRSSGAEPSDPEQGETIL